MKKETRNLIIFLVATFIWTWTCYTPIAVSGNSPYSMPWMILLILGGMGPSSVGVLMVLFSKDKEYRRDYWRRCFSFKQISWVWWLVIFLMFPILYGLNVAIDMALGGSLPAMEQLRNLIANPAAIPLTAFISFLSGPWAEEFGWRGYALDRIMKRLGIIPGTVLLGAIWGIWHMPLFFMPATGHGQMGWGFDGFWAFNLRSIGLALIMTWVYLKTNRSILSAIFMHFTSNFTSQLLWPFSGNFNIVNSILMLVFGFIACATLKDAWRAPAPKPEQK
jgi:membrane protease YdiL (CAAX protease family)